MSGDPRHPQRDPLDDRIVQADVVALRVLGDLVDVEERLRQVKRLGPPGGGESPPRTRTDAARSDDITLTRISRALDALDIRYLRDAEGSLLAMWERHAMLFTVEGPDDEILVMRARVHATVPPEWADRAYRTVNEWNHTRRFCKAYVADPLRSGQLPVYAELQVPLEAGIHEALLVELLDCGAAVAASFVDWLHGEGGLL